MLSRSLRARHGRRITTFAGVAAVVAAGAIAIACGIDAVATKVGPDLPDTAEAATEASLPKSDAPYETTTADADADALLSCPTANGVMVAVDAGGLFFCIDATEVTTGAYDTFVVATGGGKVDSGVFDAGAPAACAANTTYTRGDSGDAPDLPVARIDWCDAYDYCKWAGKHLCGKQVAGDASTGEWSAACSGGGKQAFPYGATFEAGACNESMLVGLGVKPVKSSPACQGSVPGLYDMNGNLSEWVDNCTGTTCSAMGGYFYAPTSGCAVDYEYVRAQTDPTISFRCCARPR